MTKKSHILVVDDNEANLRILEEVLGDEYELSFASSGAECLEYAKLHKPDLVLLDIMMPGLDGYETCRRLRALDDLRHVKIILVSAKAMLPERLAGYEAGADDYVTKPFDEDELLAKVRVFLRLKSSEEVESLKSSILRVVGREVRGPLNGILAAVQMLAESGEPFDEDRREWAEIAVSSCTRLLSFVERVELMDRLASRQVEFELREADLGALVAEAAERQLDEARTRGVVLRVKAEAGLHGRIDAPYFALVVDSLLERALDATPYGGVVELTARSTDAGPEVHVRDQAGPLTPEEIEQLFEVFVEDDGDQDGRSHGLNLAIAREVLRGHRGELRINASAPDGKAFILALPDPARAETVTTASTARGGDRRQGGRTERGVDR